MLVTSLFLSSFDLRRSRLGAKYRYQMLRRLFRYHDRDDAVVGRMLDQAPTERMVAAGLIVLTASLLLASVISGLWTAVLFAVVFGLRMRSA